ncbi:Tetratricopeptide repeat protein 16 [Acropora cervicornis]|uniref:Tetratricopeptide repeat protein 16 n=1 Tax=Acropora cervicornis TaxID=6130 RepID=A0AAD9QT46_ACRCE|nr:Tetratricopeptide repeat protein 16 [Acropora cervicornis]
MSRNTPTEVVAQPIANGGENEALKEPQKGLVKFVDHLSESDENSGEDSSALNQEVSKEIRRRRNTIVNSFRLAELVPTTNTPHSQYRRKSIAVLTTETVIDAKAEQHFMEGCRLSESDDHNKAILFFTKAINLKPEIDKYYVTRGESYLHICDFQSAILNFKKACILDPDNEQTYSRLAFLYFLQGQCLFDEKLYSEALESFSRAAEMKPEVIGYHTRSVACLAALQRHGECLALVNKRLEEETDNPDLFIMRARLHELFRNSTLCYYDVKDALALAPDNKEAKTLMASLEKRAKDSRQQAVQLHLVGKYKEALAKISIAIETNPSVADFHVFRGALHRRQADFNAAIDDYLLAMDKTDHNETSKTYMEAQRQLLLCYNDFAVECFIKGFYDEAVVLINKAIKGEKKEKGLYINRGDYQQALEMDSSDWSVRCRLSVVYNEFGILEYYDRHYLEAIDHLTTSIHYNPRVGAYYLSRARARYMIEDMDGARLDVLMSLYLDPQNKDVVSIFSRLFPGRVITDVMKRGKDSKAVAKFGDKSVLPPITESVFPEVRSCMEEKDFHINIIKGKKKATRKVQRALSARQDLSLKGPRVESKLCFSAPAERSVVKFGAKGNTPKSPKKPVVNLA